MCLSQPSRVGKLDGEYVGVFVVGDIDGAMLGNDVGGFEVGISISKHALVPLHVRFRLFGYG